MSVSKLIFPPGFFWGAATASYQIEGACAEDGKSPSIWDRFAHEPGRIEDAGTGDTACDHYHLLEGDVRLMKQLGLKAYRFSVSWPRVMPGQDGKVNEKGLGFYCRLVDLLLEAGIEPFVTLYHWDLPARLQDRGGWPNGDTAREFAQYAGVVARALGDRVHHWVTHNEPWVAAFNGYFYGAHAPGLTDLRLALQAAHTILLSHGMAALAIRANAAGGAKVGITHNLEWVNPASESEEDRGAARRHDGAFNRWFLDPVFKGSYPADMLEWYGKNTPRIGPTDMRTMAQPLDFLGVNYYTRRTIAHDPAGDFLHVRRVRYPFAPHAEYEEWEICPEGLFLLLRRVHNEYGAPELYVTENGTPLKDRVNADGRVDDRARIEYLSRHFAAAWQAIQEGVKLRGYFVWSLMDNFEWNFGFSKPFGLVHVDLRTLKRTIKESGFWYSRLTSRNAFEI